jgi:hypothetical protein
MMSLYNITKPEHLANLFRRYGDQYANLMMMFRSMGREEPTPNNEYFAHEENWVHDSITVAGGSLSVTARGATTTITVDAATNGATTIYAREGDIITAPNECQILITNKVLTTGTTWTLTLKAVRGDQLIPIIVNGAKLAITSGASGYGTNQPEGAVVGHTPRGFRDQIIKEEFELEGQEFTRSKWVEYMDGGDYRKWYTTGISAAEYRLGLKTDGAITFGEQGDGNLTVASGLDGAGNEIPTTRGMVPWIRDLGQVVETGGTFDTEYLKLHSLHMKRNGAVTDTALAILGNVLFNSMEDAMVADLATTNVDYTKIENTLFKGNRELSASWNFKYITKYGMTWAIKPYNGWSNPKTYGLPDYHQEKLGLIMPWGSVKDMKSGDKVSNISTKYIAGKGYSRKIEVWPTAGAGGGTYVHDVDKASYHLRAHIMLCMLGVNQCTILDPITNEVSISGE